ncbi:MAG: CDP-alcohol phosphatidyltransferase family protein [Candidatus Kerfeldbacteria bacterium]|nr:CDP-alcohol phosphatidyltransferase family protein [Candidatus Kerfeldbacteria bacterium]
MKLKQHIPNAISTFRGLLTVSLLPLFFLPHSRIIAQVIIVSAILLDKLDGTLARWWKVESELGKRLESIIDPFQITVAGLYIVLFCGFPANIFFIGLSVCGMVTLWRMIVSIRMKKLFYEKSPISRVGAGLAYVTIFFFLFTLPGRNLMAWLMLAYTLLMCANYARMISRAYKRTTTR